MKENKPVIFTEKLNLLFQKELNKRELIWLRLTLEAQGLEASDHKTESIELHEEMAKFISNHWWGGPRNAPFNSWTDHEQWKQERNRSTCLNRFWQEVGTYLDQNFLDEKAFRWIEETGRQPNWISKQLSKLYRSYRTGMSTLPLEQQMLFRSHFIELSDKERLIARFDSWSTRSEEKLRTLKRLQHAWDKQLIGEQPFNWYNKEPRQKKQKYECAWLWYSERKDAQVWRGHLPSQFSKLEDVLTYIDSAGYTLEESLYHLEQIKKKFKGQQVAANRKDKKQTNLSLSNDARQQLDTLAKKERMTRTELVELLIANAYENDVLR